MVLHAGVVQGWQWQWQCISGTRVEKTCAALMMAACTGATRTCHSGTCMQQRHMHAPGVHTYATVAHNRRASRHMQQQHTQAPGVRTCATVAHNRHASRHMQQQHMQAPGVRTCMHASVVHSYTGEHMHERHTHVTVAYYHAQKGTWSTVYVAMYVWTCCYVWTWVQTGCWVCAARAVRSAMRCIRAERDTGRCLMEARWTY